MLRTALVILSGNAAASLLLLVRNLVIARLISVEDYGIAATFGIIMALIEMASYLGLQQQIVQSKDGEDPHFQAALQGFQVLRGVVAAIVLFVSAGLIARFLGIPEIAWAYQVIALVPLLTAFQHFDIHRLNRSMRFGPLILTSTVPAVAALMAVWPLYAWLGDYRVMLWSMMLQLGLGLVVSHLVAERPYRLAFDRGIMAGSLKFGWPLLVNGILMFAVFQGDKLIVGRAMGMEALAIFAMGMTLTLTPTLVMAKSLQNFFLPQLSSAWNLPDQRLILARVTIQASLLMGSAFAIIVALVGESLVYLVLGEKYIDLIPYLVLLAILQAVRTARTGPSVVAFATGHTENAMIGNLFRLASLPLSWLAAVKTGNLYMIILIAIGAELAGHLAVLMLLRLRSGIVLRRLFLPHLACFALLTVIGADTLKYDPPPGDLRYFLLHLGLLSAAAIAMPDLWNYIRQKGRPADLA